MDYLNSLLDLYSAGIPHVFSPRGIFLIFLGSVVGICFGVMPGLSSTMALALFTPLTFGMTASDAIIFLIAVYINSGYGGAITAVLINIPGTPAAIMTGLDGHPLAKKGQAGRAIGLATSASFLGGMFGLLVLMTLSPMVATFARQFGSWEYAMLALLGLTLISFMTNESIVRGLIGAVLGLLIATVGGDPVLGYPRFTGEIVELTGGLNLIVLLIGLFGFSELFAQIEIRGTVSATQKIHGMWSTFGEALRKGKQVMLGALVGVAVGILPGVGGSIGSVISYGLARRISKNPEEFGHGASEGMIAAESSNNADIGGALVPMMTMGIPGDPMTAVLIGALMIHGLAPGPGLFEKAPAFVSSVFLGYFVAMFFLLFLGMMLARPFARLISLPRHLIIGVVAILCVLGTYTIQNSLFDVGLAVLVGMAAFYLKKVGIGPAPIVLGIVLGPLLEHNLRRAILLTGGDLTPFVTRPLSAFLLAVILLTVLTPLLRSAFGMLGRRA